MVRIIVTKKIASGTTRTMKIVRTTPQVPECPSTPNWDKEVSALSFY